MTTAEKRKTSIRDTDAKAGNILMGYFPVNQGLRIKIGSVQKKGNTRLVGSFDLLDAGSGTYARFLQELEGKHVTVNEALEEVQKKAPQARHIFTPDSLRRETER